MEIQRYGNHLEIIVSAPASEDQKKEIAALDHIVSHWKSKCATAESCTVALSEGSEHQALALKTIESINADHEIRLEFKTTEVSTEEEIDGLAEKKSHLKDLIMLAIVDGEFDDEEQKTIVEIGKKMGVPESKVDSIYNESVLNPDQIESIPAKEPAERLQHLTNLCRVILADGKIADWESVLIYPLAVKMGFDPADVANILEGMLNEEKS